MKFIVACMLLWSGAAVAQAMNNMPGMASSPPVATQTHSEAVPVTVPASTRAYKEAMGKMMAGMEAPYSGDADRDFVTHMMPHHQGAIDMAEAELNYGTDAKLKQLAGRVVAAQEKEIGTMQTWLDKHQAGTTSPRRK